DDADTVETMTYLLRHEGYEVHGAPDGPTALTTAQAFPPDVVLLDIGLPKMDGWEVARRLREQNAPFRALLVAMTGYEREHCKRRSQEVGIDMHLVKPVAPDDLFRILQEFRQMLAGGPPAAAAGRPPGPGASPAPSPPA